ncbi:CAP domain-containing protein [Psychrobacter sp. H8-1]|uniref:CAP domain-containing protein n=1 Tax=Psychrobacter sp. H8-1 TaxID=2774129 RepID=UPI001D10BDF6|nr:CAP domain-containing protein [Psychrobacter sp. H8-1]
MMTFNTSERRLAIALFAALFLTACGGGGDGSDSPSNSNDGNPIPSTPETPSTPSIPEEPSEPIQPNVQTENDKVIASNDASAALVASGTISSARRGCGLSGLSDDPALEDIAIKHANYIKYVYAKSTPTAFNAHYEGEIEDIKAWTGSNNPFFTGDMFEDRIRKAAYPNSMYGVTENIAQTEYFNSDGILVAPEVAALSMTKSLLAAPYHLRSLMLPSSSLTSSAMVAYKPYGKDSTKYQGYIMVNHASAASSTKNDTVEGIFTYPCQGVSDTVTALYNESPDPFRNPNGGQPTRDLRINPIGQPVYISMPKATNIKVSNIKFRDIQRNIDVPVDLLDYSNDPHKRTAYELPQNQAFILPLTDSLQSCEVGRRKGKNCGLYGNSKYQVSFDVLVDNKTLEKQSFTFTTGEVTY